MAPSVCRMTFPILASLLVRLVVKEAKMGKVMRHTLGIPAEPLFRSQGSQDGKECRSEERFSRNAETDIVCRPLLEKKKDGGETADKGAQYDRGSEPTDKKLRKQP